MKESRFGVWAIVIFFVVVFVFVAVLTSVIYVAVTQKDFDYRVPAETYPAASSLGGA